jgi:hypothetical protein
LSFLQLRSNEREATLSALLFFIGLGVGFLPADDFGMVIKRSSKSHNAYRPQNPQNP